MVPRASAMVQATVPSIAVRDWASRQIRPSSFDHWRTREPLDPPSKKNGGCVSGLFEHL